MKYSIFQIIAKHGFRKKLRLFAAVKTFQIIKRILD